MWSSLWYTNFFFNNPLGMKVGNCLEQLSGLVMDGENVRNSVNIQLFGVLGVSEVADIEAR